MNVGINDFEYIDTTVCWLEDEAVMVSKVYVMSQFADGGIMATTPYISGSNYLMKMSDYKKGKWQEIWDGLFWRFMHTHRTFF